MLDVELYISKLIFAHLQGTITNTEREQLESWLDQDPQHRLHFEESYQEHTLNEKLKRYELANRTAIWTKTLNKIQVSKDVPNITNVTPMYTRIKRIAIVAAIVTFICGVTLYFYNNRIGQLSPAQLSFENDVAPGMQGATLTLTNGKQIKLSSVSSGHLAQEAGMNITKNKDGELIYENSGGAKDPNSLNTLSTANGQTFRLRLPDGSVVWLNAGSSLTYSANLIRQSDGKRHVTLSGEAYFEIAKNKEHPFVVQSGTQLIEVLGTKFNVNAYPDEPAITTTLMEGSVKVTDGKIQQLIKPGQQVANNGGNLQPINIDTDNIIDWKDGDFYLNHVDFKVAMRKIARWYDVDIIYDVSTFDGMESGGWIARDKPLSHVLKAIESSGMVRFRIEGRTIHVTH